MSDASQEQVCPIVGIGSSAGGLEAVNALVSSVSGETPLAFVLVAHLDPNHESMMVDLVSRRTKLSVQQVVGGETVKAGNLYIIPPGKTLRLADGKLALGEFSEPRGLRRPIDDFFQSLALNEQANAACVILSGTGADGSLGLRAVKEHGGISVAQDPATAQYDGMPMSAVGTGLVDYVLPPVEIVPRIEAYFKLRAERGLTNDDASYVADHVDDICTALRRIIGHDFSGYKRSTLTRRVERRMQVLAITGAAEYVNRLNGDETECEALFRDLLINVTNFFRDPEMFEMLQEKVITPLVKEAHASKPIRIWVAGCSSGEEAYTMAILLADTMDQQGKRVPVQIFATDIDQQMLAIAREGSYSSNSLTDIPERLRMEYTIGTEGRFTIIPRVRDMIHFSGHSLIKDPPFSKLDLISCRNLLIYLGDKVQRYVMPLMHYALKPEGFLFLGPSESIGRNDDLFEPLDQRNRIFRRLSNHSPYSIELPTHTIPRAAPKTLPKIPIRDPKPMDVEVSIVSQRVLDNYAPAFAVVNSSGELLSTSGRVSKYLGAPSGKTSAHITDLTRHGLSEVLGRLLREVSESGKRRVVKNLEAKSEFGVQTVDLAVDPMRDGSVLVVFSDVGEFRQSMEDDFYELDEPVDTVRELEEELRLARFRLRSTVEELETANEELKSSNEEMMSMNEELQSANEELSTVNEELKNKVDLLSIAGDDMNNFLTSSNLAMLVVDRDFKVKSFTDTIGEIFPIKTSDRGRKIADVAPMVDDAQMFGDAEEVLNGSRPFQRIVERKDGTATYNMRILPYVSQDGTIDGVTFTFTDISELLSTQKELLLQSKRLKLAHEASGMGIFELNLETGIGEVDDILREVIGFSPDEVATLDKFVAKIHADDQAKVADAVDRAIHHDEEYRVRFRLADETQGVRWIMAVGQMFEINGTRALVGVNFSVTTEAELESTRELLLGEINHRVKNLFAIISAMMSVARRNTDDIDELVERVRSQISALARAHSITQGHDNSDKIMLSQLLGSVMDPYVMSHDITLNGPDILLDVDAITPIGLIIHEWATNSTKYGGLANESGNIDIQWETQTSLDGSLTPISITWREKGGERPSEDFRSSGFGSILVQSSAQKLEGSVTMDWVDGALELKLTCFETPQYKQ